MRKRGPKSFDKAIVAGVQVDIKPAKLFVRFWDAGEQLRSNFLDKKAVLARKLDLNLVCLGRNHRVSAARMVDYKYLVLARESLFDGKRVLT